MRYTSAFFLFLSLVHGTPLPAAPNPKPIPGKVTLLNRCSYPVQVQNVHYGTDPNFNVTVQPGQTWSDNLFHTPECNGSNADTCGGPSIKVSGPKGGFPMQFEYAATGGKIWYNLSLIDCLKNPHGCVGHEVGYSAYSGPNCRKFQCGASEVCDVQAYFIAEYDNKPNPPVEGCPISGNGLAFEICAAPKAK